MVSVGDRSGNLRSAHSSLQAQRHGRSGFGFQHIPALRLATRLAQRLRLRVVRMHLHRQLLHWETASSPAGETRRRSPRDISERVLPAKTPVFDDALRPGQPCLAHQLAGPGIRIPGPQIALTPDALAEPWLQPKRRNTSSRHHHPHSFSLDAPATVPEPAGRPSHPSIE